MKSKCAVALSMALAVSCRGESVQTPEPPFDPNVIAVVLGKHLTLEQKDKLSGLILGALLEKYAKDNKIEPTDQELDSFVQGTEKIQEEHQADLGRDRDALKKELESTSLSDADRKEKEKRLKTIESILDSDREMKDQTKGMEDELRPMKRKMAVQFVKSWKVNKSLYEKYGGRIIFQQAGAEPLDAYRKFLKDQERLGAFRIYGKEYEQAFWRYFTDDSMHTFCSQEEGEKFMKTPWWLLEDAPKK
ncbi:MAG TPA: hypothetical protein VJU16_03775 [Planctomycetota bacterium]|nr:hypothetical protein [Planctomycetota bacterium]